MALLRRWTTDLWGALSSSGIFSETASTTMDTEDTLSLPESLQKEYRDLRTQMVDEKKRKEVTTTPPEEDEGMKLQENEVDDDNISVTSTISESSSSCRDVEELFSDSGLESSGSVDDVTLVTTGECGVDCFCAKIREWLERMADRDDSVGNLDESWREESTQKKSAPVTMLKDLSKYNLDPYPTLSRESYRYAGERDKFGRIHGRGTVYFPNGRKFVGSFSHGARCGSGELFEREGARILSGDYVQDRLNGQCEISTNEGGAMEYTFMRGIASGPVRRFSPTGFLQWFGRYDSGLPVGFCWRSNDGEGWYVGSCNRFGRMTGDDVVYLYPDLHTALVGSWNNDVMRAGRLSVVTGITMKEGYMYPTTAPAKNKDMTYRTDISGFSVISATPLEPDPYEVSLVRVGESTVPGSGEGLFAARDIPSGTVLSFYNGVRFHDCHAFNDWEHNSYKIRLNEKRKQILDIPPASRSLQAYSATLAHKVNHSFFPNCRFSDFAHPRFGRILCVKASKALRAGDELFCNYGYSATDCPVWYKEHHDAIFFDARATIPPITSAGIECWLEKVKQEV